MRRESSVENVRHLLNSAAATALREVDDSLTALDDRDVAPPRRHDAAETRLSRIAHEVESECLRLMVEAPLTLDEAQWLAAALQVGSALEQVGKKAKQIGDRIVQEGNEARLLDVSPLADIVELSRRSLDRALALCSQRAAAPRRVELDEELRMAEADITVWAREQLENAAEPATDVVFVLSLARSLRRLGELSGDIVRQLRLQRRFDPALSEWSYRSWG